MEKLDRKELKHDRFAEEVQHSVEYAAGHKSQFVLYGGIAAALLIIGLGGYFYMDKAHTERQAELMDALKIQEGVVVVAGGSAPGGMKSFPSEQAKADAATKAFSNLALKYSGKDEGEVARYYMGVIAADQGKLDDAAKQFQQVIANAGKDYSSLAKFSLAQIYTLQNKTPDAEKLLKELEDSPSMLVSKEQAQIERARIIGKTKPEEARKILEPLRSSERSLVSRTAISTLAELGK